MPYFSFSIKENLNSSEFVNVKKNITYYSKNTKLWKLLHSKKMKSITSFIQFENRIKVSLLKKNAFVFKFIIFSMKKVEKKHRGTVSM